MAAIWRRFVRSIVIDSVFFSYLLLAGILHGTTNDTDGEIIPFILHAGHGVIAVVGIIGVAQPELSFPATLLQAIGLVSCVGDALSVAYHLSATPDAVDAAADRRALTECRVYASLSVLLFISAANVYWASRQQSKTF